MSAWRGLLPRGNRRGIAAVALVLLALAIFAATGPGFAPYAYDAPVGPAGEPSSSRFWLGTDALGRDVLSRVMHGGVTVLSLSIAATVLSYIPGVIFGLAAGFRRTRSGLFVLAGVDILQALPSVVLMLIIVAGLGPSIASLLLSVVLVQLPSIARIVRAASVELSVKGYVDVALSRGETKAGVLLREILPNIAPVIFADIGVRFGWSITLIASMNYLGLGLPAPTADWGLMIAENREFIGANPWAVVAPAALLAVLTIGVSTLLDAYTHARERVFRT